MKNKIGVRRRFATGTVLTAGLLAVAAVAWACTVQIGTLTVCSPVPLTTFVQGACARKVNTNGTGSQAGSIMVSKSGSKMSVLGSNFISGHAYSVLYNSPRAVALGANCHQHGTAGVTDLLDFNKVGDPGTPWTVNGPSWNLGVLPKSHGLNTPNVTQQPAPHTGTGKLCVQDEPDRVNGNQIVFAVI